MKSTTTPGRTNPRTACCTLLTALVFCAIVVHAQSASADTTRTFSIIGSNALASFADGTGAMRTSASGAVQTQFAQMKSYESTLTNMKPASPNQQVYSRMKTMDSQTGTARFRVGSLDGRSYTSAATFIREAATHF
ncbi:MAG: hypothetical protein LH481_07125 [Burkholderiales bacterium]|nr:hypothetical protein [Burkholderiales bacterium]